jgi:hypothetical protein
MRVEEQICQHFKLNNIIHHSSAHFSKRLVEQVVYQRVIFHTFFITDLAQLLKNNIWLRVELQNPGDALCSKLA